MEVLNESTKITNITIIQRHHWKNGRDKTTKIYFAVILRATAHKEDMKRIIEIWGIFSRRFADQARVILKKGSFSDLEILETRGHLNDEYDQDSPILNELLNTENQKPFNQIKKRKSDKQNDKHSGS